MHRTHHQRGWAMTAAVRMLRWWATMLVVIVLTGFMPTFRERADINGHAALVFATWLPAPLYVIGCVGVTALAAASACVTEHLGQRAENCSREPSHGRSGITRLAWKLLSAWGILSMLVILVGVLRNPGHTAFEGRAAVVLPLPFPVLDVISAFGLTTAIIVATSACRESATPRP